MVAGLEMLSSDIVASQGVKILTIKYAEILYIGGALRPPAVNVTCHTQHRHIFPNYRMNDPNNDKFLIQIYSDKILINVI
jgi:hypothetical protein